MHKSTKVLLCSAGISLMLGGCSGISSTYNNQDSEKAKVPSEATMVSVQEYTGEGYALPYGKGTDKIADDHFAQIEEAAIKFFKENYKTAVTVHNIVGARDGATVFVESKGEPHFYTYAAVPIDKTSEKVDLSKIQADEYQVQNAIQGGLYHMIFKEEFSQLNTYLHSLAEKGKITGKTEEALQNVGGHGFMTPYYFISTASEDAAIKPVYDLYIKNPEESIDNLKAGYDESLFDKENFQINIQLFMKDKQSVPSKKIFNQVTKDLDEMKNIPKGTYSFYLNDNYIHAESSEGAKDNSLKRAFPNYIIKE